jgi:hypothetical protein
MALALGVLVVAAGGWALIAHLPAQATEAGLRQIELGLWRARPAPPASTASPAPLELTRVEPATGPLRVHPDNPRYFADGTGRAIVLVGSHTWANFQDIGRGNPPPVFDYAAYLDFLVAHNHNFFRLWTWEQARWTVQVPEDEYWFWPLPYQRTGPGTALDGQPKFDLTQFNTAYFERMHARAAAAGERGIYVSIMLFDGWSISRVKSGLAFENPWLGHPYNAANNVNGINGDLNGDNSGEEVHTLLDPDINELQAAYVSQVIEAVNDLDNILYEISNESPAESEAWQAYWVDFVRAHEAGLPKQHPVGVTVPFPGDNAMLWSSRADWVSPNAAPRRNVLSGHWGNVESPIVGDGARVILNDTDHLCGICGDHAWLWKSFLRGLNPIFMDPYGYDDFGVGTMDFRAASEAQDLLRRNMGYILAYANRLDLAAMEPRGDLCSTGYCLVNLTAGEAAYLIYLPESGQAVVRLAQTRSPLAVEWLDPQTGSFIVGAPIAAGSLVSFKAPWPGEAVLFLREQSPDE